MSDEGTNEGLAMQFSVAVLVNISLQGLLKEYVLLLVFEYNPGNTILSLAVHVKKVFEN